MSDHLETLKQREAYLRERVKAKSRVGWQYEYDEREANALAWAIEILTADSPE